MKSLKLTVLAIILGFLPHLSSAQDCDLIGITDRLNFDIEVRPVTGAGPPYEVGDIIEVDFLANDFTDVTVFSTQFTWDPTVLCFVTDMGDNPQFNTAFPRDLGSLDPVSYPIAANGLLPVGFINQSLTSIPSAPDGTRMMTVAFRICGEANECTDLSINALFDGQVVHTNAAGQDCQYSEITLNSEPEDEICIICGPEIELTDLAICKNQNGDIAINFSACGGQAPYTWEITQNFGADVIASDVLNQSGDIASFLLVGGGDFEIAIEDANGVNLIGTFGLEFISFIGNDYVPLIVDPTSIVPPLCSFSTGTYSYEISGGQTSNNTYNVFLSDGQTKLAAPNIGMFTLPIGDFTMTVEDMSGCIMTTPISFDVPPIVIETIVVDSASCLGAMDGRIFVTASGGTPFPNGGYEFNGNAASISFEDTEPMGGFEFNAQDTCYELRIEDANGCVALVDSDFPCIKIPVRDGIEFEVVTTQAGCSDNNMATSFVSFPNTGPYSVQLWNTSATPDTVVSPGISCTCDQLPPTPVQLAPGEYRWDIIQGSVADPECEASFTFTVAPGLFPMLEVNLDNSTVAGCGADDGVALIEITNGSPPYSIEWADFPLEIDNNTVSNLAAGEYNVTITDDVGCSLDTFVNLFDSSFFQLATSVITELDCTNPLIPAVLGASVTGTTETPVIEWSDDQGEIIGNGTNVSVLNPGTYTVAVTVGGCTDTEDVMIMSPGSLSFELEITNRIVDCDGNELQAPSLEVINVTGATGQICFLWTGGAIPPNFDSDAVLSGPWVTQRLLSGGVFTITVSDKTTGCRAIQSAIPEQENEAEVDFTPTLESPLCPGGNEGQISISGGAGVVLTCEDADGNPIPGCVLSGLTAGEYDITIIDQGGCPKDTTFTIEDPEIFTFEVINIIGTLCFEGMDGSAEVNILTDPSSSTFNYLWNGINADGPMVDNLSPGDNFVIAVDANSCADTFDFFVPQPDMLVSAGINPSTTSCIDVCDGEAIVTISGGTLTTVTDEYSYEWSDGGSNTMSRDDLCPGQFFVTITDDNNCMIIDSVLISEPDSIIITSQVMNLGCVDTGEGGSITLNVLGGCGQPYTYNWPPDLFIEDTENEAKGLEAGDYIITVTDTCGCSVEHMSTVIGEDAISGDILPFDSINCVGELACIGIDPSSVSGGSGQGYTYQINSTGDRIPVDSCVMVFPGQYILTLIDSDGCRIDLPEFFVDQAPDFTVDLGPDIDVDLGSGNTSVFADIVSSFDIDSIVFSGQDPFECITANCDSVSLFPISNTIYSVVVTDENGCTTFDEVAINLTAERRIYIANTFMPGTSLNDRFMINTGRGVERVEEFVIYDRWGNLVFELPEVAKIHPTSIDDGWDGFRGDSRIPCEQGVYVYYAEVLFEDGIVIPYKGGVTLIRE